MEKNLDARGRHRNHTISFRMSEAESELLDRKVAISGLTKQDYIIRKLSDKEVVVQGNPRVYKALKKQMEEILQELRRIESGSEMRDWLLQIIELTAGTLAGLREDHHTMTVAGRAAESENASAGNRGISEHK